jgi:glucose/arabinose dehydrogenase
MKIAKRVKRRRTKRRGLSTDRHRLNFERLESRDLLTFAFLDFSDISGLQFNGSANVAAGALLLTDDVPSQVGSVFYNEAMTLDESSSFSAALAVQMTGGQGTNGADGMAFVIQNTPAAAAALGSAGGGLGYGGIGAASIAIELDTYQNAFDPNNNNVSLLVGGDGAAPLVTALAPVDLNGGSVVHVWVDYDGPTNLLEVFVSSTSTRPASPLFSQTIDLAGVLGGQAYFGVSAATGGLVNEQRVLSWSVDTGDSTLVEVYAAGATSTEAISLLIDGVVVSTFSNVGGNYDAGVFQTLTYASPTPVTAEQVRVAFANDGTTPGGANRDVRIDAIAINGTRYESEASSVFSIGSGAAGAPDFAESEFLLFNGYFQYASAPPVNPGAVGLESSVYSVDEDAGVVNLTIRRTGGSDGIVTVDYRTFSDTAIAGQDFTATTGRAIFFPGQTSVTIAIPILNDDDEESTEKLDFTIDNVLGGASLRVPRTAIVSILDDENPAIGGGFGFTFDNFNSTSGLQFNGSASVAAGALLLTDAVSSQAGSVFYNEAMTLDEGTSFSAALAVQMTGGQGTNGADGMAFIIQNTPAGAAALGSAGGGLGYGGIGPASIAIELDTYQNAFDPNSNNVSLLLGGDGAAPIVTALAPIDLNGGAVVYVWVEYDGASNLLEVFVSGTPTKPATPLISQTIDLAGVLGNQAYFGVSAATGGLANEQRVLSWSVESSATEPEPTSVFTPETVVAGLTQPTGIDWSNDGRNMYIAEKRGVVRVLRDGQLLPVPLLDLSASVNNVGDRGMLDLAIHPDLAEHPYIYVVYAYDPPEVMNHTGLAGPDGRGNRAGRMSRFTLDAATNYTTVVPGSEVVMLGTNSTWDNFNGFVDSTINFTEPPAGILPNGENLQDFLAADSLSHTVGMVEFGPDGALYVSNGDGTSYNQVDARAVRVQDIDNLSGKILRLDPLTGAGLPDNPFYDGDPQSNRSKVYQYGFRNPFRFTIDATGKVYVGDVGWVTWEEVNQGAPGDNFGWPYFEGGNAGNLQTDEYQDLPQAQAFYASGQPVKAPLLALNHSTDLINAIVMGDRYDGSVYSAQYQGDLFFNDLGQGIVRNISFNPDGSIASVDVFAQGVQIVVQIVTGPDDYLYFVQLDNGIVGRWIEMLPQAPVASRQAAVSALSSPESVTGELLEDAAPTVDSLDAIAVTLAVDRMSLASSQRHTARERYFQAVEAWRPSADVDGEYVGPTATDRLRTDEQHIGVSRFKRAITRVSQASRDEVFDQLGRQHDWLAEPADLRLNRTLRKRN